MLLLEGSNARGGVAGLTLASILSIIAQFGLKLLEESSTPNLGLDIFHDPSNWC